MANNKLKVDWADRGVLAVKIAELIEDESLLEIIKSYLTDRYTAVDVFGEDAVLDEMRCDYNPEEVFEDGDLNRWADENNYVKALGADAIESSLERIGGES